MYRTILIALVFFIAIPSSLSANDNQWMFFNFSKTTPDGVILSFGPPSLIKTEEKYSDWVINKAQGCGQINIYVMSYSIFIGDLRILMGPFGKASEAEVVIDDGKMIEVVWIYDSNQLDPAFRQWMDNKEIKKVGGKSPNVLMLSIWRPKKGTIMTAECFTGGGGEVCRGPISVHYLEDTE